MIRFPHILVALSVSLSATDVSPPAAVSPSQASCTPATGDARALLARAADVTGLSRAGNKSLHLTGFDVVSNAYQSDRPYPPYISAVTSFDRWLDPSPGAERSSTRTAIAGYGGPGPTTLTSATASYVVRDTQLVASETVNGDNYLSRPLDVWAVLRDWSSSPDVRVIERCAFHDFARLVLERQGPRGREQLYLDPKSGFPVKVDRMEPHYLFGQVHAEFVYETWQRMGSATLPVAFRMVDGEKDIERVLAAATLAPADSAPRMTLPAAAGPMAYALPPYLRPSAPDTIRVAPHAFLLRNPGYIEAVALLRDTVFMLEATQGEERARQDSAWIGRLFPGRHPIVVVVTDVAWPHIAGVRFWAARGATIITHPAAKEFVTRVIERRWTTPDLLERRRGAVHPRVVAVKDSMRLAGGDLLLFPINGIGSETAIAAFSRPDAFLWASDYIQSLSEPTLYLNEVSAAVSRVGVTPRLVAAQHLPLSPWSAAVKLVEPRS